MVPGPPSEGPALSRSLLQALSGCSSEQLERYLAGLSPALAGLPNPMPAFRVDRGGPMS